MLDTLTTLNNDKNTLIVIKLLISYLACGRNSGNKTSQTFKVAK